MVANLSAHKRGWDDRWEEFSIWAERGQTHIDRLLYLVDEDTQSFNRIMAAFQLPKGTDEELAARKEAIQAATKYAIEIPLEVMQTCYKSMEVMEAMAKFGNPNSITDAGVGALCARTGVLGAFMNVKINCGDCDDKDFVQKVLAEGNTLQEKAMRLEDEIRELVEKEIS